MGDAGKRVILVGLDDSNHSYHALETALDLFFVPYESNPPFKLVVVHARSSPSSLLGFAGPGSIDVLPMVEKDLVKTADWVCQKARDICSEKSVEGPAIEVIEGDPRNVMVQAAEKHGASVVVLGSHGYGAVQRVLLGSVSDYLAHHARCSVMIVKKPKTTN